MISLVTALALVALGAAICGLAIRFALHIRHVGPITGPPLLVGELGEVRSDLAPLGTVYAAGQLWSARACQGVLPRGTWVRVLGRQGLVLEVESIDPARPVEQLPEGGSR